MEQPQVERLRISYVTPAPVSVREQIVKEIALIAGVIGPKTDLVQIEHKIEMIVLKIATIAATRFQTGIVRIASKIGKNVVNSEPIGAMKYVTSSWTIILDMISGKITLTGLDFAGIVPIAGQRGGCSQAGSPDMGEAQLNMNMLTVKTFITRMTRFTMGMKRSLQRLRMPTRHKH
ncbi:hypothetical protein [Gimesia chilikensis]|uniref:hypothetical protein n=1 Tax=Gimesia chilikensis TaxID=2605989 RepID=UPI00119D0FC4|nr:hypothetical protein [Gimesia chilikensis]